MSDVRSPRALFTGIDVFLGPPAVAPSASIGCDLFWLFLFQAAAPSLVPFVHTGVGPRLPGVFGMCLCKPLLANIQVPTLPRGNLDEFEQGGLGSL